MLSLLPQLRKVVPFLLLLLSATFLFSCSASYDLVVLHEVTGPIETNCYLLFDARSGEAALIDVGGAIDSLLTCIENKNLKVKYIFATHSHMDHVEGVPAMRERFPDAEFCCNKADYEDFLVAIDWMEENWPAEELEEMKKHPDIGRWFTYDLSVFGKPDIYVEDNQTFWLGDLEIKAILSPGHSRGSICYHAGDRLFSGDVLFYRRVGRTDLLGGSGEAIVESVRRLYSLLPDSTRVYPGHGEFTDIGSEKTQNEEVTITEVNLEN